MCLLQIIQITSSGSNGEVTEQTMMVSSQENVAAFHVEGNTTSATVVHDYKPGLIGLRVHDRRECSAWLKLPRKSRTLTHSGSGEDSLSYTFSEGQLANRTALGTTLNILCSDIPIYWAGSSQKRRWSIYVHFWGITIYIGFGR
ncbi:unnamed protein product [Eretmochelys imbricata]